MNSKCHGMNKYNSSSKQKVKKFKYFDAQDLNKGLKNQNKRSNKK
jgi:hypothetical protein